MAKRGAKRKTKRLLGDCSSNDDKENIEGGSGAATRDVRSFGVPRVSPSGCEAVRRIGSLGSISG